MENEETGNGNVSTEKTEKLENGDNSGDFKRTELDTGYPKFNPLPTKMEIEKYDYNNLYRCDVCNEYFIKSIAGLDAHFQPTKPHKTLECVYCKGPVYTYYFKGEKRRHHKCTHEDIEDTSTVQ